MSSDYWENLQSKRVKELEKLEKRRNELKKEIELLRKPDMNRMVAEKLRTTTSGCNCQRMVFILVQDGEVKTHETLTPTPCFLREATTKSNSRYYATALSKQGESYYREQDNSPFYFDFESKIEQIERHPKLVQTIHLNGKQYYQDECQYADEVISEGLDDYSCPDEIKQLPNGIYQVLWEQACFSYETGEGTEGDAESDYKIYDSVPLWDFLKHKESLLAAADPEANELVEDYIYIQQTKQNRKKPCNTITPEQFTKGELPWE